MMNLRKLLFSLSLLLSLAGFSASVFAATSFGAFTTYEAIDAACTAARAALLPNASGCNAVTPTQTITGGTTISALCTAAPLLGGYSHYIFVNTQSGELHYGCRYTSCPANTITQGGKCLPKCTIPGKTNLPATDPACVANPCTQGESSSFVWSPGMRTGPGDDDHNATYNIPASQCDGVCTINKPASLDSLSCVTSGANYPVPIICTLNGTKSGDTCTTSDQASPATGTTTPEQPKSSLSCTDGMIKQADGSCAQPATPGTASTSTETGAAATPGAVGCPVGMSSQLVDGQYRCVGTAPPSGISCPTDYTRVGDDCVSNHVIAPGPQAAPGTGGNATEGTLKKILDSLTGNAPALGTGAANSALDGAATDRINQLGDLTSRDQLGWQLSFSFPATACSPLHWSVFGQEKSFDPCPLLGRFREGLAYLLYGLAAVYLWRKTTASVGGQGK